MGWAILVHGGAGEWRAEDEAGAVAGVGLAVGSAMQRLAAGGSALDAAVAAVVALEDDALFNAGTGAVLNRDGDCETDAAVMDGATLRFGAVAAMRNAGRAIEIARAVYDDGEHVLLCAEGAWRFARERGFAPSDPATLITPYARERWERARDAARVDGAVDPGTVGAVAIDADGHVAAATSTGGTTYKAPGRIGDTPLCGCGTYADDAGGGASATGHGESMIRATTSLHCVNAMRGGRSAHDAAWQCIDALAARVGGTGGIICIDRDGELGAAHNTPAMAWGAGRLALGEGGDDRVVADVTIARNAEILRT
jgi:beta-aspartyl-peptidase (threonine type)